MSAQIQRVFLGKPLPQVLHFELPSRYYASVESRGFSGNTQAMSVLGFYGSRLLECIF